MTTIQNLPHEVLSDIFIRLLAKEVAQMRSVCKPWNTLLSHSSFVNSHLHRSIQNKDDVLMFFGSMFSLALNPTPFTACLSRSPHLELTNLIKPVVIPEHKNGCGFLIGSVNGLICFVCESSSNGIVLCIWNPSLSAILTLPPSSLPSCLLHFGFGFDPKSDDYKVVKLKSFSRTPNMVPLGEVYSMKKGSWKLISSQTFPLHIPIPRFVDDNHVCVDDNLHWLCDSHLESKPQMILGFDLGEEAFIEIPLPETILDFKPYKPFNVLGVLGGELCVMSCIDGGKCEVWVMDEYGVAESLVKHHVLSQFSGDIVPYGFTSKGEFIFQLGVNDDRFGLYDPVAAETKDFKIMSRNSSFSKVVEYVDSLVWMQPANHEISSCDISQLQNGK